MRLARYVIMVFGLLLLVQTATLIMARRAEAESQMVVLFASNTRFPTSSTSQIYTVRPDGQSLRCLTSDPSLYPTFPLWSPDGQRLVITNIQAKLRLATMNRNGRDFRWINTPLDYAWNPVWSPDGKWLLFLGTFNETNLYRIRPNSHDLQQLTDDPLAESEPVWSPDGAWLAYVVSDSGDNSLWIMHPDGSDLQLIHRQQFGPYALVWSADSRWLYYSVRPKNLGVIYRYDMTTNQSELLHAGPPYFQNITPSPDGQSIAFITQNSDDFRFAIWRQDLNTRDVEIIAPLAENYANLRYSPDGHWLMFIHRTPSTGRLYRMRPDGSDLQRITPNDLIVSSADWQPIIEVAWHWDGLMMIGVGLMGLASVRLAPKMKP
ncbi:MAG: hypothetical protein BroJett018_25790 [Chloroflexota bacterium]|nr:MAG: hypothetical protein BroJett018_25790 [Chloroflexota bacterium]